MYCVQIHNSITLLYIHIYRCIPIHLYLLPPTHPRSLLPDPTPPSPIYVHPSINEPGSERASPPTRVYTCAQRHGGELETDKKKKGRLGYREKKNQGG
ncbi:uncharacterized protein K452DRAFT_56790 [Aplosporella prunicola CBS 121167]|uniref:Uncharacterized protein n=1 Tax=Aplosporella prunicola CBS 121167 TaxID=1176127 RepID=A0A6A6B913_9PEZI|nr:uncharacterized protein K452DRAFT_56790 [Aplosporella prunicola CBS 121167]KAF2139853.1 hypothetical protein K452DRAFT_56790 [Aplosporella prunicola CBS 121167]